MTGFNAGYNPLVGMPPMPGLGMPMETPQIIYQKKSSTKPFLLGAGTAYGVSKLAKSDFATIYQNAGVKQALQSMARFATTTGGKHLGDFKLIYQNAGTKGILSSIGRAAQQSKVAQYAAKIPGPGWVKATAAVIAGVAILGALSKGHEEIPQQPNPFMAPGIGPGIGY